MVGWHHQLNGQELEQALGYGEGQGSLVCSSLDRKESDRTEQLSNNNGTLTHTQRSKGRLCVCTQLLSLVQFFVVPWIVGLQAPLSLGFSRQEH